MPHAPRIKNLAYQIDPDCWKSYSGQDVSVKRALDVRRNYALKTASDAWAKADAYTRRVVRAEMLFGARAGLAEERKIMKEIEMERPWEKTMTTKMPPLKMKMLLHFGTSPAGPFVPENVRKSEAYTTHVKELIRDGLIERPTHEQRGQYTGWAYKLTAKGQVFMRAVLETPLPVRTEPEWKMPGA